MTATREVKIVIKTDLANSATALKQFEASFNSLGTTIKNVEVKAAGSLDGIKQAFHTVTLETNKTVNQINKQVNSMFDNAGESAVASIGVKVKSKSKQLRDQLRTELDELRDIANKGMKSIGAADGTRIRENKTVADSISGIERKLAYDIANIHAELNKTIDKILADRQRKIISQATATNKLQQAMQSAGAASGSSFSSADAAKVAYRQQRQIAEAERQAYSERLNRYNTFQTAIAEQINRTAELERLSLTNNGGRIAAIRQQQAYTELDMQRNLQREIAALRQRAASGHITESDALGQTRNAYARYAEQLQVTRNNMEGLVNSMQPSRFMQMVTMVGSLVSVSRLVNAAITTTINLLRSIPQAGIEMQSTISALHASMSMNVSGGDPDPGKGERLTADAMEMLRKEADRTGISLITLEKNYRTFTASAVMSGESISDVNSIFRDMNSTITALHMTGDRAELTFLALSQMFNKGKIQSEELVKQLGNLLPGAFAAFARANGRSTEQLIAQMKAGTVRAHETIKNFISYYASQYSDAFRIASTGLNAELGRMETAWTDLSRAIFMATSEIMTDSVRGFTVVLKAITPTTEGMHNFGIVMKDLLAVSAGAAVAIGVTMSSAIRTLAGTLVSTLPAFLSHPLFMPAVAIGAATAAIYKLQTAVNTVDFSKLSPDEQNNSIIRQLAEKNDQIRIFDSMSAPEQFVLSKIVDIKQLRKERDNLMYSMQALKDDAAELQRIKDAAGIDFSEQAFKDIEAVRKALHPAVVEYEQAITAFEAIRERQRKLTTHESDGYVVPGAKGMDRKEGEAYQKYLNDRLFADIDKADKKDDKSLLEALKKRTDAIKAELETSISQVDEKLSMEQDLYSTYNTDLQQVYDEGLIGLNTFYKTKLEILDQEYALTKQALLEKTQLYTSHLEQERSLIQQEAELKKAKASVQTTAEEIKAIKPEINNDSPLLSEGMFTKVDKAWAKYKDYIEASAKRNKVDPALILGVMKSESAFNKNAVSPAGAGGLMQLLSGTFNQYMKGTGKTFATSWNDPESSIEAGTRYLSMLGKRYHGSVVKTAAGYNAGEGTVDKWQKAGVDFSGRLPYKETNNYTKDVMKNMENFSTYIQKSASTMQQSMKQMEVPKEVTQSHTAVADVAEDSSTRISNASKKVTAARTEEKQAEAKYLQERKAIEHDYLMLIKSVHDEVATPSEKFEQRKQELDQLREGIEGIRRLTETDYVRALKLAQDELDKTLEKEQKRLTVNTQTQSILKELNKNTRRELMDDRSNYLESAREQITEYAIEHKLAMESVEKDMQRVAEAYDTFIKAQQQGAIIGVIKTGFNGLFKDLVKGTRSFTESFTELFDNAINQIIDNSLQNLWNGFQKVFSGINSGWGDIASSLLQLGIAGIKHLVSNSSKPAASSSETFAGETTGLSKFRYADTFGREVGSTYRTGTEQRYADSLNKMASIAYDNSTSITGYLSSLSAQIQNSSFGGAISGVLSPLKDSLYNTFQPAVDFIKQGWDKVTGTFTAALPAASSGTSLAQLLAGSTNGNFSPVANGANLTMWNDPVSRGLGMSGYQLGDLPYSPTPTTAGAESAASGASSISSKVTIALAVMKAGYEIISTALDNQAKLGTQVANSMYAVSDALLAINLPILLSPGFIAAIPGMIAAGVTNALGAFSDVIDGDWKRGVASAFGGIIGRMIYSFMPQRSPNMWINNFSPSQENLSQRQPLAGGLYERGTNKGKFFGTDTALGSMELSYHEIPRKTDMEKVDAGFKQLLLMYKATNASVAANLNEIDLYRGRGEATIDAYLTRLQTDRIAFKQELESMDVADITKDYYDSVSKWFRGIGTFAGTAFATIYDNLTKTFAATSTDSSVFSANIAQVSAILANQMKDLPVAVIDNLTKILKTPGAGGNPDDVLSELVNNLASFEELFKFVSGSQIGATVSQTKVSEWIVSWSELGLEIQNAGNAWAAYLSLFKKSVSDFNKDTFISSAESYYTGIKDKFVGMGYSDKQSVSLSNTSILGAQQLSEFSVANNQLLTGGMVFAQRVAEMSKKTFTESNEAIDAAILAGTKEGVLNEKMTREAMTAILVRTKAIDAETAALANFDVNMAQNTKTLLENYSSYGYMLVGVGTNLSKLGLTVSDIPGQIDLLTASFGDMSNAVETVRTAIQNAFGTSAANQFTLNEQTAIQASIIAKHPTMGQIGIKAGMSSQDVDAVLKEAFKDIPNYMDTLIPVLTSPAYLKDFEAFSKAGNTISSIKNQTWKENEPPKTAFSSFVSGNTKTDTLAEANKAAEEAKRTYESYMEAAVDVNKQLSQLRMTDVQKSISDVKYEIQKFADTAAKAGQTISNLSDLQSQKLMKVFLDWGKPLYEEFTTGKMSDAQKNFRNIGIWYNEASVDLAEFASELGWTAEDIATAKTRLAGLRDLRISKIAEEIVNLVRSVSDEVAKLNMSPLQASFASILATFTGRMDTIKNNPTATLDDANVVIQGFYATIAKESDKALETITKGYRQMANEISDRQAKLFDWLEQSSIQTEKNIAISQVLASVDATSAESQLKATRTIADLNAKAKQQEYALWSKQINRQYAEFNKIIAGETFQESFSRRMSLLQEIESKVQNQHQQEIQNVTELLNLAQGIRDHIRELKIDSSVSPLSMKEQLDEAGKIAMETYNSAKMKDPAALGKVNGVVDKYLNLARQYYGPNADYAAIFADVTGKMEELANIVTVEDVQSTIANNTAETNKWLQLIKDGLATLETERQANLINDTGTLLSDVTAITKQFVNYINKILADLGTNTVFDTKLLLKALGLTPDDAKRLREAQISIINNVADLLIAGKISQFESQIVMDAERELFANLTQLVKDGKLQPGDAISLVESQAGFVANLSKLITDNNLPASDATTIYNKQMELVRSLNTLLGNGIIDSATIRKVTFDVASVSGSLFAMYQAGTIPAGVLSLISSDVTDFISGISAAITTPKNEIVSRLAPELYSTILDPTRGFLPQLIAAVNLGSITKERGADLYNAAFGDKGLLTSALTALREGTFTQEDMNYIKSEMKALGFSVGDTFAKTRLDAKTIQDAVTDFAGKNKELISTLGLTETDLTTIMTGLSTYAGKVGEKTAEQVLSDYALGVIGAGVTTLAENMRFGLSGIEWLQTPGWIVYEGVNMLAYNIAAGLNTIPVDTSPIASAISNVIGYAASMISQAASQAASMQANIALMQQQAQEEANRIIENARLAAIPTGTSSASTSGSGTGININGIRIENFATGASFSNGIVNRPTIYPRIGEAGPEGVLPLTDVGGKLGVSVAGIAQQPTDMTPVTNAIERTGGTTAQRLEDMSTQIANLSGAVTSLVRKLSVIEAGK